MSNFLARPVMGALYILGALFFFIPQVLADNTRHVDCDKGESIQHRLDKSRDGDVIEISGNCSENILIERDRIALRGEPGATINGPDATVSTIHVAGHNIRIEGFTSISGGRNGIKVGNSASAVIEDNTIQGVGRDCISINRHAYATVERNTLQNCTRRRVNVSWSSAADIFTNTITGNGERGIQVQATSGADIAENTITDNGSDGIRVRRNAHIRLSEGGNNVMTNVFERNGVRGVRCQQNASIRVGTAQTYGAGLDANTLGNTSISASCVVSGIL